MSDFPPAHNAFHLMSEGSMIHGGVYSAAGQEAHPLLIMSPEIGGYDRLTSLFNPVLMAGINVAYYFPRGMWNETQRYTKAGALQDLKNTVAYLRTAEAAAKFRIDPDRIALGGLSGGGGTASLITAAEDATLPYAWALAPGNVELLREGTSALPPRAEEMRKNTNGRIDPEVIRNELMKDGLIDRMSIIKRSKDFAGKTILLINGARDELCPIEAHYTPIFNALVDGGADVTGSIIDSNHLLLTKRDELHSVVISWLREECGF